MTSEDSLMSPESTVTSLLATSGHLRSSLVPEPVPSIRYRDRQYVSASEALDAYIADFQRSLQDSETSTGKLELAKEISKPHPRNRDVLKTSLTDSELKFLNIPIRNRGSDRLSVTTDDLIALPPDGSLPVTRTSALLSQSGSFPLGLSLNSSSWSQYHFMHRPAPHRALPTGRTPAGRKPFPVDDLLMGGSRLQRQAPPPNILLSNRTHPPDTPRSHFLPRWMTSQKSEMDFSGMSSVPDLMYPGWLKQCEESSDAPWRDPDLSVRVPSWVGELDKYSDTKEHRVVKGHTGDLNGSSGQCSLRELRLQFSEKLNTAKRREIGQLFKGDQVASLIFRAEQVLNSPSIGLCDPAEEHNSSGDTEEALDADRSWDNPPVTFKAPVPVGGADEPPVPEELQRSKSTASCSSGYSSRKHPGPVETLKHMLFSLQAVQNDINQSNTSSDITDTPEQLQRDMLEQVPQLEKDENVAAADGESLQRALHHLQKLKTLVDDMNKRNATAVHDGRHYTEKPADNITNSAKINKHL
ncbi:lung adenoma susceptibility protein 2 [Myxocyprinus asiaticus]|uniref:lung adenoma susceptibility protein 2 n=1 Tax=Myxocyprinus asiaticus TaxID=70543 RepID=UPI002222B70E|nr:lung adenoma susceptibility protein 2 [Myxocyprinus asiaticus]